MPVLYFMTDSVQLGDLCSNCNKQLPYGSYRCTACSKMMCSAKCREVHDLRHADLTPGAGLVPRMRRS